MPTSNYMLDVQVEIAFTSGYTTPDASRVWTDVSPYVELAHGITDTFGRQDELSTADANDLTLVLDNSDGRFTAGRSASPYYPNVKIGRPIRVTATPPGGTVSRRFVGFINQWPVEWDGTTAYAKTTITATSRLSRLGLSNKLRSMPEEAILDARPAGYWTLGDASGSTTAAETSGNSTPRLVAREPGSAGDGAPVVFGNATGPGTDNLTAAQFAGYVSGVFGEDLAAEFALPSGPRTVRAAVRLDNLANMEAGGATCVGTFQCGIGVAASGLVNGTNTLGTPTTVGPSINDGATHDVACVRDGTNEILYVDGAAVATAAASAPPASTLGVSVGGGFPGTISHVAVYDRALTAAEVAAQAKVMFASTAAERTDQRLSRILGWAGVAASEISTQTGSETMTYQQTGGMSVVDALRECESTEGGVLFDGRDGRVTFHNRSHRYTAPVATTFDMAAQQVEADYAPKLDRSTLTNDVTVDNPTTGESARSTDSASITEYGSATSSAKSVASTYDPLQQKAAWLVYSHAEPRSRVPSLTVDVLAQVGGTPSADTILALTIGSRIQVINQPTQADTTTADYFVEGYSEAIGPESYRITFNLSPAHPSLNTFMIGDPVRGAIETGGALAL